MHIPRLAEVSAAEVESHDGMTFGPVPAIVDVQTAEQRLITLEKLLQRVQQQALAEAPRARKEVVLALVQETDDETGLVDVVAILLAQLAEGLQPDRQPASGLRIHGSGFLLDFERVRVEAVLLQNRTEEPGESSRHRPRDSQATAPATNDEIVRQHTLPAQKAHPVSGMDLGFGVVQRDESLRYASYDSTICRSSPRTERLVSTMSPRRACMTGSSLSR